MPSLFTEDTYEQAIIELFENMGYEHLYAPDYDRDYTSPLLDSVLRDSLVRINRGLPLDAIEEAIAKLKNFDTGSLLQKNITFMDYLQNGITVKFFVKGEEQSSIVRLVDYEKEKNNTFYVVNQFTFLENGNNRRPDIILFINGLPLVLMELKSPAKDEVGAENAYNQIRIICRIFRLCFIIMQYALSVIFLQIKQEQLLLAWIDLWNGKQRMETMKKQHMLSSMYFMKECFRKIVC